jgi:hypothetical protein
MWRQAPTVTASANGTIHWLRPSKREERQATLSGGAEKFVVMLVEAVHAGLKVVSGEAGIELHAGALLITSPRDSRHCDLEPNLL